MNTNDKPNEGWFHTTVRLTPDVYHRLTAMANAEERSVSAEVRYAIVRRLEEFETAQREKAA